NIPKFGNRSILLGSNEASLWTFVEWTNSAAYISKPVDWFVLIISKSTDPYLICDSKRFTPGYYDPVHYSMGIVILTLMSSDHDAFSAAVDVCDPIPL
ncbi:6003_t:CDS:2, partial [Acaulospora colombiana]